MPRAIGRDQVRRLIDQAAQVVEVLAPDEYEWAHIRGAVNIPLRELDRRAGELDRDRPVVVYCNDYQ